MKGVRTDTKKAWRRMRMNWIAHKGSRIFMSFKMGSLEFHYCQIHPLAQSNPALIAVYRHGYAHHYVPGKLPREIDLLKLQEAMDLLRIQKTMES